MEYASGGELFERICKAGRFGEDEVLIFSNQAFFPVLLQLPFTLNVYYVLLQARFFFQQLISGVSFCHAMVHEFGNFSLYFLVSAFSAWKI